MSGGLPKRSTQTRAAFTSSRRFAPVTASSGLPKACPAESSPPRRSPGRPAARSGRSPYALLETDARRSCIPATGGSGSPAPPRRSRAGGARRSTATGRCANRSSQSNSNCPPDGCVTELLPTVPFSRGGLDARETPSRRNAEWTLRAQGRVRPSRLAPQIHSATRRLGVSLFTRSPARSRQGPPIRPGHPVVSNRWPDPGSPPAPAGR